MRLYRAIIYTIGSIQFFVSDSFAQQAAQDSILSFAIQDTSIIDSAREAEQLMQTAITHYDGKRFSQSLQLLNHAIALNNHIPLTNVLYYYKALTLIQLEKYQDAKLMLDTAIYTAQQFKSNYYLQRAKLYWHVQDLVAAKSDLEDIAANDLSAYEARTLLGAVVLQQNNAQGALWWLDQAVQLAPNYAEAYYYRAFAQFQLLRPTQGCDDLRRAAQLQYPLAQQAVQQYCK